MFAVEIDMLLCNNQLVRQADVTLRMKLRTAAVELLLINDLRGRPQGRPYRFVAAANGNRIS